MEECRKLKEEKARLWHLKKVKDCYSFQKAGVQWIREGDANSSYFHNCINKRKRSNKIDGLIIDGVWEEDVDKVNGEVFRHFKDQFSWNHSGSLSLSGLIFNRASYNENIFLVEPFMEE